MAKTEEDDQISPTIASTQTDAAEGVGSRPLPSFSKGLLVLDANALIKGMDNLLSSADALITIPEVVHEIKDKAANDLLDRLPFPLHLVEPSGEALRLVIDCAKKTGDFGVLSRTDIRLCALALDCATAGGALHTPIHPVNATHELQCGTDVRLVTEEVPGEDEEGEEEEEACEEAKNTSGPAPTDAFPSASPPQPPASQPHEGEPNENEEDDDWITPENIHSKNHSLDKQGEVEESNEFEGGIACITSDYAMQNVLLHLGVPLVGTHGLRISTLRLWLLRCTACFTIVTDTTRQFCPGCGSGDTLRRVHYVINDKGEKLLFINFKNRLSTRGTIYNLPRPRGGKRGTNRLLVLREDQLAHVIRGTSAASLKAKQAMRSSMPGNDEDLSLFGMPEKKSKKRDLAAPRLTSSYYKYNMNEKKKVRAAHRK